MPSDHGMRASDKDRDAVVAALRDAFAAGRLTLDEFDERTTQAYASKTWGDLRGLTQDLPEKAELGADLPKPPDPEQAPARPEPPLVTVRVASAPARRRRRVRLMPIIVIWVIVGIAAHSPAVALAALLVLPVSVLVSAFMGGWRDGDKDRR